MTTKSEEVPIVRRNERGPLADYRVMKRYNDRKIFASNQCPMDFTPKDPSNSTPAGEPVTPAALPARASELITLVALSDRFRPGETCLFTVLKTSLARGRRERYFECENSLGSTASSESV